MPTDDDVASDVDAVARLQASLTPEQQAELVAELQRTSDQWIQTLDEDERDALREHLHRNREEWVEQLSPEQQEALEEAYREGLAAAEEERRRDQTLRERVKLAVRAAHEVVTLPGAIFFLLSLRSVHPNYRLTWWRRIRLGVTMFRNTRRITTGTSYKAHLAMAAKLFEIPPSVPGVVVECGCWQGGSTVNLSLICDIVGRELIVYDTFEGLPTAPANDKYAWFEAEGWFRGDLEVVQDHVRRFGAIDRCTFRKGLFSDTLPHHTEPIALAFLDVDYASSLHDCVLNLWPHLADRGYVFIDEYTRIDYCALFFSERWWRTYFDAPAPGMMGVGTGVAVGQYFLGPLREQPAVQAPTSAAYTRKDFYGVWDYDPDSPDEVAKARGT